MDGVEIGAEPGVEMAQVAPADIGLESIQYLVQQGVNPLRITAQGYGETELDNRCANGIDCSESEHQQNRRTVIKVTGYLDSDEMDSKTLEDIKREEQFQELLQEVQNQEVIQVSSDEELPDEIRSTLREEDNADDEGRLPETNDLNNDDVHPVHQSHNRVPSE